MAPGPRNPVRPLVEHVSLSRVRRRERCERIDWYHTAGGRGGYMESAPVDIQRAYALRRLTSWPAVVGQAIHHAAARRARALRDGESTPNVDDLLRTINAHLNHALSPRRAKTSPGQREEVALLREVYFDEWPGGRIPGDLVVATKRRVAQLLRCLETHPVWNDLATCDRADIRVCDTLDALVIDVNGAPVRVFAAPDLVWISRTPLLLHKGEEPLRAPVVTVLDWKTGRDHGASDAAWEQLVVYAWWVSRRIGLPTAAYRFVGRLVDLGRADADGCDTSVALSAADLALGEDRIVRAAASILAARGSELRVPMASTKRNLGACRRCSFTEICLGHR